MQTDAFFASMTLPQLLLAVISSSLTHVLVPLFAGERGEQLRHDIWAFFILVGSLFFLIAILLSVTAQWWIPATLPGFNDATKKLTIELTRIQLVVMVFSAASSVQWASYYARQRFVFAEFTSILAGLAALALLAWALPRYGILSAAWLAVTRYALQAFSLLPGMGRIIKPDLSRPALKTGWNRMKPILLGSAYYKTDPFVDRYLLSFSAGGNLSLYYFAQQLLGTANQILNKAICAPAVPVLSSFYKNRRPVEFQQLYYRKMAQLFIIGLFGLLLLLAVGVDMLDLLVGRGSVTRENVSQLHWILIYLSGVFLGGSVGQLISSSFYAIGDTRTIVKLSAVTYTIYIPTKVVAYYTYGISGLAIVTSMLYIADCLIMIYIAHKKKIWRATVSLV